MLCTGAAVVLAALATPVLFTIRAEATWLVLLPLNKLLASTPLSRKLLLVSRCPFAQIGWLPETAVYAGAARQFRINAGRKNRQSSEAAGRQRDA